MYLLKDRLGEDKVNAALRSLLSQYAFKGAPYPRSTALIDALRAQAPPEDQGLITDLFEKITLVDLRARDAKVTKRADGKYDVTFTVEAHKFYDTGKGKGERDAAERQLRHRRLHRRTRPGQVQFRRRRLDGPPGDPHRNADGHADGEQEAGLCRRRSVQQVDRPRLERQT
ncbi:MAG: hypothetical protein WDN06_09095 [Asticcacaulis sp.]